MEDLSSPSHGAFGVLVINSPFDHTLIIPFSFEHISPILSTSLNHRPLLDRHQYCISYRRLTRLALTIIFYAHTLSKLALIAHLTACTAFFTIFSGSRFVPTQITIDTLGRWLFDSSRLTRFGTT